MMRIGIDVRMVMGFPTGIGNYSRDFINAIITFDRKNKYLLIGNSDSVYKHTKFNGNVEFKGIKSVANKPLQHIFLGLELKSFDLDVFWTNPWGATLNLPCKYIVTIHDLIYHRYPEFGSLKSKLYELFLERKIADKANGILTISEFSKGDITYFLGIPKEKISNVGCSSSEDYQVIKDQVFIRRVMDKYKLKVEKYFVYLGNRRPHKNLIMLMKAFNKFREKVSDDIRLVIIGGIDAKGRDSDSRKIFNLLEKLEYRGEVKFLGKIFNNKEVAAIFGKAIALVHPSMHEGFGLTPLEAMKSGCAVVASNVTAVPEVVGNAGILVDPGNMNQIASAMIRIYRDIDLRDNLKLEGLKRSRMFTWENCARLFVNEIEKYG